MVTINGVTAVVTGGQRGLGNALVHQLLRRSARKVYATAHIPVPNPDPRIVPVALDVTNRDSVAAFANRAADTSIVVNNAAMAMPAPLLTADSTDVDAVFDTNVFGVLRVTQAFAPVLASQPGRALVNIHSVLSWASGSGTYGASKAALWSLTNSLRLEMAAHTLVVGVHVSYIDTGMTATVDVRKSDASVVAEVIVDGVEHGHTEVLVDDASRYYKSLLTGPVEALAFDPAKP